MAGRILTEKKQVWEILVPRLRNDGIAFSVLHHQEWDKKVREIAGGLTIFTPTKKGEWISSDGRVFSESMIPVRICCGYNKMEQIMDLTAKHYSQLAVMMYLVSEDVFIKEYDDGDKGCEEASVDSSHKSDQS